MKKVTFTIFIVLLLSVAGFSQSLAIFGGYLNSAFEDQEEAAGAIELGGAFVLDALPVLEAGVEFSTLISPFEFEMEVLGVKTTSKFKQTMFGVFGKYNISLPALTPYIRGGVGYYTGSIEVEAAGETGEQDFKSAIGFNIGGGVQTFAGLYGEFIYHIVSKELDVENAPSAMGSNYWGLRVGYSISLL